MKRYYTLTTWIDILCKDELKLYYQTILHNCSVTNCIQISSSNSIVFEFEEGQLLIQIDNNSGKSFLQLICTHKVKFDKFLTQNKY